MKKLLLGFWMTLGVAGPPVLAYMVMIGAGYTWHGWQPWLAVTVAVAWSILGTVGALYACTQHNLPRRLLWLMPVVLHIPVAILGTLQ